MLDPTSPSPGGALSMLQAACRTGDTAACEVVSANFVPPAPVVPVVGSARRPEDAAALARQGVVGCTVELDGLLSGCKLIRSGGSAADAAVLAACAQALYAPGRLQGQPFKSFVYVRYEPSPAPDAGS